MPHTNTHAPPEKIIIDTSSDSPTNSDAEDMSDDSESVLNTNSDQGEDIDISFASSGEPVSPEASQQGKM